MTMDREPLLRDDETLDEILGGRLRVLQKKSGYRFSIDAVLLAHFAAAGQGAAWVRSGNGSGVLAMIVAQRDPLARVLGVDIREECVEMADRSVRINGLEGRVEIRLGDTRQPEAIAPPRSFDAALFNPPYRRLRSGRMNPDPARASARHEIAGTVGDFLGAAAHLLREGGRAFAIWPASRAVELLVRMRDGRIEPKRIRMVHSRPGGRGEFLLVEGRKGGGEELAVLPPLFIYGREGGYTSQMSAIFRDLGASPADGGG